jgi:hypothetical protein
MGATYVITSTKNQREAYMKQDAFNTELGLGEHKDDLVIEIINSGGEHNR